MQSLSFFGGVGEIGGNKILLEHKDTRIFLDFGKDFAAEKKYFDMPFLSPFYIPDLREIGALPNINGLYRDSSQEPPVDGVLVTHAHEDHYGYVPLLDGRVRVLMGEGTKEVVDIRNEVKTSSWDRKCDHMQFDTFRTGDEIQINDITVLPVHVDHSIPSAYGFIIFAGNKTFAYTGDLRLHGHMKRLTEDFVRELEKYEVETLICEGTNITSGNEDDFLRKIEQEHTDYVPQRIPNVCEDEDSVRRKVTDYINESNGLFIAETSPADVDRVRTIWKSARDSGRELILDHRLAYLVYELQERDSKISDLPTPDNSFICLSRKKDRSAEEGVEAYKKYRLKWEQSLIDKYEPNVVWGSEGRKELSKNPDNYVICTDNAAAKFLELSSCRPECNYLLSKSEPFNEEMMISFSKLLNWLSLYNIKKYPQVHVSGHCYQDGLERVIEAANPEKLIPIHTEHPELFQEYFKGIVGEINLPVRDVQEF